MSWRQMRRFKQQLSDKEAAALLARGKRGVLAVLGDEGYPYTVPVNYVFDKGHVYVHSAPTGHKIDAVRNYSKASFCVLEEEAKPHDRWWYTVCSVVAFGRVCLMKDRDEKVRVLRLLGEKYFPPEEDIEAEIAKTINRVEIIDFEIEHLTGKRVNEE